MSIKVKTYQHLSTEYMWHFLYDITTEYMIHLWPTNLKSSSVINYNAKHAVVLSVPLC